VKAPTKAVKDLEKRLEDAINCAGGTEGPLTKAKAISASASLVKALKHSWPTTFYNDVVNKDMCKARGKQKSQADRDGGLFALGLSGWAQRLRKHCDDNVDSQLQRCCERPAWQTHMTRKWITVCVQHVSEWVKELDGAAELQSIRDRLTQPKHRSG